MSADLVTYNGYRFNEYSNITVNATMQPDESNRTILYNRYRIRVETTIYAEDGDIEGKAGQHFERIRDRLSKQGQQLEIHHEGFGLNFEVNSPFGGKRDVAFGPKPLLINWEPVGHINAVEVVWECEVCVSSCYRWNGLMSLNYGVTYRIDKAGYTTRTVSGYLEIAMSRTPNRRIPDTADAYRDKVIIANLPNYERETTWNLSLDKRRADFTIVDSQIRSPNEFPAGVISIRGNHSVNWSRRQMAILPQTIRVSIELAMGQPRSRAIEIFNAIANSRLAFLPPGANSFFDNFVIEEDLFGNTFNFSISYRFYLTAKSQAFSLLGNLYSSTGIGQKLGLGSWQQWKTSVAALQSHRGQAGLSHDFTQDQIIDLCSNMFLESTSQSAQVPFSPPGRTSKLCNKKPSPKESYLHFETWLEIDESIPSTIQISVEKDDLTRSEFDPTKPLATLGSLDTSSKVERFVESQAGRIEVVWKGYAERVGYEIPRPDKLTLGDDIVFTRIGKAKFIQKFLGNVCGQPVYAAAWNQRYVLSKRPLQLESKDLDEWEGK